MNRRTLFKGFAATATGVLVPEPVRAYSFVGGWAEPFHLGKTWPPGYVFPVDAVAGDWFWHRGDERAFVFDARRWVRLTA
jgi:hypothetical protein